MLCFLLEEKVLHGDIDSSTFQTVAYKLTVGLGLAQPCQTPPTTSLMLFPSLPWAKRWVWSSVFSSLMYSALLSVCLFSSFRQFQESEATDPAALMPLQPSS